MELSKDENPELPIHTRPVFNYSMKGIVAAFSGIRKREELVRTKDSDTCAIKTFILFTDGTSSFNSFDGRLDKKRNEPSSNTFSLSSGVWR